MQKAFLFASFLHISMASSAVFFAFRKPSQHIASVTMIAGDESFDETAADLRVSADFDAGFALISPVSGTTASTELG